MASNRGSAYFVVGTCYLCGCLFTFHPLKVPKVGLKRRAICRACAEPMNVLRDEQGLAMWDTTGAYGPIEGLA